MKSGHVTIIVWAAITTSIIVFNKTDIRIPSGPINNRHNVEQDKYLKRQTILPLYD